MENIQTQNTKPAETQPKFLRVLASFVSYICHPVFMPIIMTITLKMLWPNGFAGVQPKQWGLWLINIGSTAVFFPLVSILIMKPLGFISSLHMPTARERTGPLMAVMTFYFWVSHVFNSMPGVDVPLILKVLLLGNFWGVIVLFIVNIFTKVSMHTAAAGGMLGIFIVLMIVSPVNLIYPFFVAMAIAGIIGTARLILGVHHRGDVWLGYAIGILVQLGAYLYMK